MKTLFFCVFSFAMLSAYAQNTRHIGTWKSVDENNGVNMIFREDGFVMLEVKGITMGGKEFELEGRRMSTPYEIDYTSESPKFVIMMKNLETNEIESKMAGSIIFKENNTAYICMKRVYEEKAIVDMEPKDCLSFTKIH